MKADDLKPGATGRNLILGSSENISINIIVFIVFTVLYCIFFSPSILGGKILAPGDATLSYYPALESKWTIWSDLVLSGYPAFADVQFLRWYPLQLLGNYNLIVVLAYVLGSFFTYGYTRLITGSVVSGCLAGLVFGMGGFMVAHLGHLTIIHSAIWLPLILWCFERLSRNLSIFWALLGATAIAFSLLGGHPQIFIYSLALSGCYAALLIMQTATQIGFATAARLVTIFLMVVVGGFILAAVQILPLHELASFSQRQESWSYADFISYSVGPRQLLLLFFPYLLGGPSTPYTPYFGPWGSLTEFACYFGMITGMLALIEVVAKERHPYFLFWAIVVVFTLIFSFGDTPLAKVAYHLPVIGSFRAPARVVLLLILGMGVLAAMGLARLRSQQITSMRLFLALGLAALGMIIVFMIAWFLYPFFMAEAARQSIVLPSFIRNPAIWIALFNFLLGLGVLFWLSRHRSDNALIVLFIVLIIDLSSFSWFYEWREYSPTKNVFNLPPAWRTLVEDIKTQHGRILPLAGLEGGLNIALPNINLLFDLPSASGYGPLILARYADATGITSNGHLSRLDINSPVFKLLAVNWLISGIKNNIPLLVGNGCGAKYSGPLHISLPPGTRATRIRVVSFLGCSVDFEQNTPLLDIMLHSKADEMGSTTLQLLAGRDTAEWEIDRSDVAAVIRHAKPASREPFPADGFQGYWYESMTAVAPTDHPIEVQEIALRWLPNTTSAINIREITLIDDATWTTYSLPLAEFFRDTSQELISYQQEGLPLLRQYRGWLGRAWLVGGVQRKESAEVLKAVQSGLLPDGSQFDPATLALIEEGNPGVPDQPLRIPDGRVEIVSIEPERWVMHTVSSTPAFLFISQTHYPGWEAAVNGQAAKIYRTNYIFQGLEIPAGESTVILSFAPRSLVVGGIISGLGLALAVLLSIMAILARLRGRLSVHRVDRKSQHT